MNIINKLTLRLLMQNKRRTLVTIFGVIISVAMVTAVATISVSFLDLMKRQAIAMDGEWHIQYHNVNDEQVEAIKNDESTKELVIAKDRGYARLPESKNKNKPYLFIKEYNAQGFKQFPIELNNGRFPKNENEIVISEEIADDAGVVYEIGDKITVQVGKRVSVETEKLLNQNDSLQKESETLTAETTKTYMVVGTISRPRWEMAWSPGYTIISYIDQSMLDKENTANALVALNKVNRSLYEHAEKLADKNNIEKFHYNSELLRYYGVTNNDNLHMTFVSLTAIIMAVIIIGSVSLIYNAFAISVSERSRHLGMLSSVGATKKQKRNSVFFEGAVIGCISIPIGIIAGLAGIAATFAFTNTYLADALNVTEKLQVVVTPVSIIAACVISIITIFISTYMPARKASKISAIDAIRQTHDVKLSGKAVKTSKFIRKIFGMEAEIGLKNLKRNKRRYQATVFSLVISIVLFLSVSYFTTNLKKSFEMSQQDIPFDIQVTGSNQIDTEKLEELTKLKSIKEYSIIKSLDLSSYIEETFLPEDLRNHIKEDSSILKDGKYPYYINLYGLNEESFRMFAEKVGVDLNRFNNIKEPQAIVIDKISYQDFEKGKFIETKAIHTEPGQKLDLYFTNNETGEDELINKIKIGALTDQVPMGIQTAGLGELDVIVNEQTWNTLIKDQDKFEVWSYLTINSTDPMETQKEMEDLIPSDMYIYNVYEKRQQAEQLIMFMSVFTYGFIVLISLISIANIFNTISTSIALRKREFAMLKSVGMTPKGFNKMINYESVFYGIKALLYGLPISIAVMFFIYWSLGNTFEYGFALPWMSIVYVIAAIFIIVSLAMIYSISKIKKENIIDGLKQENI